MYTGINVIYEYVGECENHKIDKFKIIKGALRDDFMWKYVGEIYTFN